MSGVRGEGVHLGQVVLHVHCREASVLKVLIVIVMLAMIASLFSGLVFLFKDSNNPNSKRTLYALGIRVGLAITLLLLFGYGFYTGQLGVHAPWHDGAMNR
jgi:hypothetical protein